MATEAEVHARMKEYYGTTLKTQDDMQSKSCISDGVNVPLYIREILSMIHDEVGSKYYGCGLAIPAKLEGMKILDLGSGSGRDCFVLSKLVGQDGHVTGIDMTEEQLVVARKHTAYHMEKFGYSKPNVAYVQGYIEQLTSAGLPENSFDIIISNCVVNLSPDKRAVISEAYKVLKDGGELYFSDMYADRDLPPETRNNKILWGEGFAGALWWEDLYRIAADVGFSPPRLVNASPIEVDREDFKQIVGDTKYVAVTYRLFKMLATREKTAKQVTYKGHVKGNEKEIPFDHQNIFKAGEPTEVDAEMAAILFDSRFKDVFDFRATSNQKKGPVISPQVDPFEYLAEKAKRNAKMASVCYGSKQKVNGPPTCHGVTNDSHTSLEKRSKRQ